MDQDNIKKLIGYINESSNIVFFGGAGVSTESGIPDFRSKDGLYNQHDIQFEKYSPEFLLSRECLYMKPKVFFEFYRQKMDTREIKPNITHYTLSELESFGKLKAIVTQNIDGLHQKAGSKNVLEIHGTTYRNYCVNCGKEYSVNFIFDNDDPLPRCQECGRIVRPDVTLYGENLPKNTVDNALNAIHNADMLIVGGTSLKVYPAASYISEFHGKHLVVINNEKLDVLLGDEDLMILGSLGEVFGEIHEALEKWSLKTAKILNFLD